MPKNPITPPRLEALRERTAVFEDFTGLLLFRDAEQSQSTDGTFDLSAAAELERPLFDSIAQERSAAIPGGKAELYLRDYSRSRRDPLYGEPSSVVWIGPIKMQVYLEKPESSPSTTSEGFTNKWDSVVWVPRVELEGRGLRAPDEGDVIRLWNTPFFNAQSVDNAAVPNAGLYFDVERGNTDGTYAMSPSFAGFKLYLKRRSEFTPERRVDPPVLP